MLKCFQQRKKRICIIFLPNSMGLIYKGMKERVPFFSYLSQWFQLILINSFSFIYLFFCSIFYSFVYSSICEPTEQILFKCLPPAEYCYRCYVVQSLSCVQVLVTPRMQCTRFPCLSLSPGVCSNSCSLSCGTMNIAISNTSKDSWSTEFRSKEGKCSRQSETTNK